ncbi:MAG: colanic acid biosynthesis glycosyltransferase WcaL [Chloroflexi bacterium]|nr:colanic acid biosynthesis glycosyltransferase WcaL [Chloroflexota bacterium]
MKPRIAYILKMYPRFSETFIVNEILELERQGVDVRIYSLRKPDDGRFHANLARVRANVIYAPQYPQMEPERVARAHAVVRSHHPRRYQALRDEVSARGDDYVVKRFLQAGYIAGHLLEHPVDALHAHFASSATRVANFIHRLIGVPYSFTAHAKDIFHQNVSRKSLQGKMAAARFVVTVSDYNRSYLQSLMGDEPADIRRLYNGIDLQQFPIGPERDRRPGLILSVGRLVEKKGFDVLIRACALLSEWGLNYRCQIIGKGEQREALKTLIAELRLERQVALLGPRPQDEVAAAYRRASVFALPCVVGADGNRDGLPTVLLEAMASGLAVVSTSLTGVPEIIDHNVNGLLVEPGDVEGLAFALSSLLLYHNLRREMGRAARRKVEETFDVRKNVAQLKKWLAEPARAQRLEAPLAFSLSQPSLELPAIPVPDAKELLAVL